MYVKYIIAPISTDTHGIAKKTRYITNKSIIMILQILIILYS